jgi:phage anti-repressor protein
MGILSMTGIVNVQEFDGDFFVDARELWGVLESNRKFGDWVRYKIKSGDFEEGFDFFTNLGKTTS